MKVTIELDKQTPKGQFALLVTALLAAVNLGEDAEAASPAPIVQIAKVKDKPEKDKPKKETVETAPITINDEDVRAKCAELKAAGKMENVKALIIKHGAQSATGVKDRVTFMAELNEL